MERTKSAARAQLDDLRRLYEEQADFVRRAVLRLGGPSSDVDDLVHDIFLVALRRRETFEGRASVTTWLYGIAIKIVASARRRARMRQLFRLDDASEPVDVRTPAAHLDRSEASRTVYGILDKIAEKKRVVFILFELEGLSGEAIAEIVGCPLKTVWTRLFHARREFLRQLEKTRLRDEREQEAPLGRSTP